MFKETIWRSLQCLRNFKLNTMMERQVNKAGLLEPCNIKKKKLSTIPGSIHVRSGISPCAHLLKRGSSNSVCLFTMWLRKDLNLAHMTFPFPSDVVVALQYRCLSQGFIQGRRCSFPFSLEILDSNLVISSGTEKQ